MDALHRGGGVSKIGGDLAVCTGILLLYGAV